MAKARAKRGQVELVFRTHGGKRPGAGRKPKGARAGASHRRRPEHDPRHPVHVTMRAVGSAAGLRCKDMYLAIREATIASAKRPRPRPRCASARRSGLLLAARTAPERAPSAQPPPVTPSAARR